MYLYKYREIAALDYTIYSFVMCVSSGEIDIRLNKLCIILTVRGKCELKSEEYLKRMNCCCSKLRGKHLLCLNI